MSAVASTRQPDAGMVAVEAPASLAVYLRVSSEEQREQGTIQTQRAALDRYLLLHDLHAYSVYADDGVSGTVPFAKRPEGRRLLADAQAGHVDTLVCYRLDRMGRNALAVLQAVEAFEQLHVRLVSITEAFDTSTPAGRLQLNMLATIAQFERDSIIQRTGEGKSRRLRAGGWMGGARPSGYTLVGKDKDAHLDVDEERAAIVRTMFGWLVNERMGCQAIAGRLNAQGVPSASGKTWRANSVWHVLSNPVYAGRIRHGDETVEGSHDAIIPPPVFAAAQRELERHTCHTRRQTTREYLLRSLVRCGHCGCVYRGTYYTSGNGPSATRTAGYRAYECCGRRFAVARYGEAHAAAHRCPSVSIQADWLEREVWADVERYVRHPDETLSLLAARMSGAADQQEALRAEMAAVQRNLDTQQAERDSVLTLFRKGVCTERDLSRQLDAIAQEQAGLEAQQRKLAARAAESLEAADKLTSARAILERLAVLLDEDSPTTRRTLVEGLVSSIVVTTEPAGTTRSGRVRLRPAVTVTYCFADPSHQTSPGDTMTGRAGLRASRTRRHPARPAQSPSPRPARPRGPHAPRAMA